MRGSKMRAFLVFLIALVAILHFSNQIEWHENTKGIPRPSQGQAILFEGEMGQRMLITSIDATKENIYVAYAVNTIGKNRCYSVLFFYRWDRH